jgi:hypothetical protein
MNFQNVVTTAAQAASQLTPTQTNTFLQMAVVLMLLSMVWKGWGWMLHQLGKVIDTRNASPTVRVSSRRTRRPRLKSTNSTGSRP